MTSQRSLIKLMLLRQVRSFVYPKPGWLLHGTQVGAWVLKVQNDWGSTTISRARQAPAAVRDFPNNTNTTSLERSTLTSYQYQLKSFMLYHQPHSDLTYHFLRSNRLTPPPLSRLRSKRSSVVGPRHPALVRGGAVMSSTGSETSSEPRQKYHPFQLGPSEDLEWYEPGGFHPVHLQDVYDLRYSVIHKLGFGGFSTVWLARDSVQDEWVALKILASEISITSTARPSFLEDDDIKSSALFSIPKREFWIDGPNGRHLCLVLPVVGPSCSSLSKGIYSTMKPALAADIGRQAVEATALLHSKEFCHGGKPISSSRTAFLEY